MMIEYNTILRLTAFDVMALASADAFPMPGGEIDAEVPFEFSWVGARTVDYIAANRGLTTLPSDTPANTYIPGVFVGGLNFQIMLFSGSDPSSGSTVSKSPIELIDPSGDLDYICQKSLDGARLEILRGATSALVSDYDVVATLTCAGAEYDARKKQLKLREGGWLLQTPLHDDRFLGTGGYEGDEHLKDIMRPIVFGSVFNVSPQQILGELMIYQVSATPIEAFSAVRDGGVALDEGNDYATYDLLAAATVAPGTYDTCLAKGLLRLGAPPTQIITCDVLGDSETIGGEDYVDTRGAIARRIAIGRGAQRFSTSELDEASFTTFDADLPGTVGWYFPGEITKAEALRLVLAGTLGFIYVGLDGLLRIDYYREIESDSVDLVMTVPAIGRDAGDGDVISEPAMRAWSSPRQATYLGWQKNYTVQLQDQLNGAAQSSDNAIELESAPDPVDPATTSIYAQETQKVSSVSSVLARETPRAPITYLDSGFMNQANALTEAGRQQALLGKKTERWSMEVSLDPYTPVLGRVIEVQWDRYSFGGGKALRCVGAAVSKQNILTLELLG